MFCQNVRNAEFLPQLCDVFMTDYLHLYGARRGITFQVGFHRVKKAMVCAYPSSSTVV